MGVVFGNNCERSFERVNGEVFIVISYVFLGLYPVVNLVYVVNVMELKNSCSGRKDNRSIGSSTHNILAYQQ